MSTPCSTRIKRCMWNVQAARPHTVQHGKTVCSWQCVCHAEGTMVIVPRVPVETCGLLFLWNFKRGGQGKKLKTQSLENHLNIERHFHSKLPPTPPWLCRCKKAFPGATEMAQWVNVLAVKLHTLSSSHVAEGKNDSIRLSSDFHMSALDPNKQTSMNKM